MNRPSNGLVRHDAPMCLSRTMGVTCIYHSLLPISWRELMISHWMWGICLQNLGLPIPAKDRHTREAKDRHNAHKYLAHCHCLLTQGPTASKVASCDLTGALAGYPQNLGKL